MIKIINESNDPKDKVDIKEILKKIPAIGYRDKDGYLVLPKDFDDED